MIIQAAKGGDVTKLTGANVAKMKKDEKPAAWVVIVSSGNSWY